MNDPVKKDLGNDLTPEQIAEKADQKPAVIDTPSNTPLSDEDISAALKVLDGENDAGKPEDKNADAKGEEGKKAEAEAGEGEKAADGAGEGEKGEGIPSERFNEAVGKERTRADSAEDEVLRLRQENQQLRDGTYPNAAAQTPEQVIELLEDNVDAMRENYETAVDGEDKQARTDARKNLRAAERALRTEENAQTVNQARTSSTSDNSFNTALAKLEATFPQINPDDKEKFDPALSEKVVSLVNGHIAGGMTRVQALQEAAEVYLLPMAAATTADNLRNTGKTAATQVGKLAPPDLNAVGQTRADVTETLKPSRLTAKQYHDLPEDVKQDLRGDFPEQTA